MHLCILNRLFSKHLLSLSLCFWIKRNTLLLRTINRENQGRICLQQILPQDFPRPSFGFCVFCGQWTRGRLFWPIGPVFSSKRKRSSVQRRAGFWCPSIKTLLVYQHSVCSKYTCNGMDLDVGEIRFGVEPASLAASSILGRSSSGETWTLAWL